MSNFNTQRTAFLFLCLLFALQSFAQKNANPWQDISENILQKSEPERVIIPEEYRTVKLDADYLKEILTDAPLHHSPAAETETVELVLPMPDGNSEAFRIVRAPIMEPGLAAKYPQITNYAGQGIDDPTAYVRFGMTQKGFHAMILSARHSTVFIDAYAKNDTENYISYYKNDYAKRAEDDFACHTEGVTKKDAAEASTAGPALFKAGGDCMLRTYRLALACTQEYATFHGGNKPDVLAEYNVAMARVNGIYETDFAVTMVLIDNTDDIIYLSEPDPYTNNQGGTMLGQNQTTCDNVIGSANYDIGHVFSTGGGGIAGLGVPCSNNNKARGVTGQGSPVNDPFYVDYVAHEIGHQFGANHTFNNSCGGNRNNSTAMEPGSASTIMGYAGICGPNVQNNSDDYFHAISLVEVYNYITVGGGSGCPVTTNNPNNPPVISVPNTSYTIPGGTPFQLTATATDPDNDAMTFCWEQMDNEISTQSPLGTNTGGPNFRSLNPTESPTRYFPSLDNIVNGTNDIWEVLPTVTRDMEFRCVVRDNNMGEGCTDEIDVNIDVDGNSGPFVVLQPNTNVTWFVGENQAVNWDVAGTADAPVSCANVDILLSLDGGMTYPITLASDVPNDGSFTVSVPNNNTTTARVMVVCADNIFLDVSDENFTIDQPAAPTFVFNAMPSAVSACNDETVSYSLDFTALAGFNEAVSLSATGLPAGASANFSPNPVSGGNGTSVMTVSNLGGAAAGDYTITINGTSPSINNSTTVTLSLAAGIPVVQSLNTPADNESGVSTFAGLSWSEVPGATNYNVVVSTSPDFDAGTIVLNENVTGSGLTTSELDEETVYYWQVSAETACGAGDFSDANAFQTGAIACQTYASTDVPVNISSNDIVTVTSTLTVPGNPVFSDVDVEMFIRHTYLGDLSATLTSPNGTTVQLFDQPGVPASNFGCSEDDIDVTLDDDAANTADDLDNSCTGNVPSISGIFQPIEALSVFNGQSAGGTWTLTVSDTFDEDGGEIDSWSIIGCSADAGAPPAPNVTDNILTVPQGDSETITNAFLSATAPNNTPAQITFTVLTLPANGTLTLNGMILAVGDIFTQQDINFGFLVYNHDGNTSVTDSFDYSVTTVQNGWFPEGTFDINIVQNNLAASAAAGNEISCNGESDGSIVVTSNGGNEPLSYSIDGSNFQTSPEFTGLGAGTYTVTVNDNAGFSTTTDPVTLTDPAAVTVSTSVTDNTVTATGGGGTGALTYTIDGVNYQASNVFSGLDNGTYTVCAKDVNDCETCTEATVAVNNVSVSATITTQISCFGESDGVITVIANGGNEPYTYSINGSIMQSSNVFEFLPANSYTVTATDNDGFSATAPIIFLNNPSQISTSAAVSDNTITVTASGGTGSLTYSIDGANYQSSEVFSDVANGTYDVCTRDVNDCEVCEEVTVAVNNVTASAAVTQQISCFDADDGIITVTAGGGVAPYTYSLNGSVPQNSNVFEFLAANNYTVTVTDNDGFSFTATQVTIVNPAQIMTAAAVSDDMITVTASGGTGDLTYSIDGSTYQDSNVFTGLPNGTYTVCTRDENDCEECSTAVVAVNMMVVSAEISTQILCNDDNDAVITVSAAGGAEPYTYSLNGNPAQNENVFTGLSAGTYSVEVVDNDGFTLITNGVTIVNPDAVTISATAAGSTITATGDGGTGDLTYTIDGSVYQSSGTFENVANGSYEVCARDANDCETCMTVIVAVNGLVVNAAITAQISCNGAADGVITVSAAGGSEPYSYSLNDGTPQTSNVFAELEAGEYSILVTDNDGFSMTTQTVTITEPTAISITATVTDNTIDASATGGTGNLTYTVDGEFYQSSGVFENLANGTYEVCARDENDCEICTTAIVAVNGLVVNAAITESISCNGEADGTITVTAAGGNEPYTYSLNDGAAQDSGVFTGLAPGMYTATVVDNDGFTLSSQTVTLTEPTAVTASTSVSDFTATVTADGGTPGYQYSTNGTDFVANNVFVFNENGTYTLYVRDANGCETTTEVTIAVTQIFASAAVSTGISCNGGADGCITATAFNAAAPVTYQLGAVTQVDNGEFCDLAPGSYTVTITDADGFTATTEAVVLADAPLLTFSYEIDCNMLSTMVGGGTGELVITLNETVIEPEITVINGTYILGVEDVNGCTMSDEIAINDVIGAEVEKENIACFGDESGSITVVSVNGGSGDYEYSLNEGDFQNENTFTDLAAGMYSVTVRDAAGCDFTTTVNVNEATELTATATVSGDDITVDANGGTGALQYSIDGENFQTAALFADLPAGLYEVMVRDENGCEITLEAEVLTGLNDLDFALDFAINPNPNNGTFSVLVNMPTARDLIVRVFDVAGKEIFREVYLKDGDFFTQNISLRNLSAGSYFVTVNDGKLSGTREMVVIR